MSRLWTRNALVVVLVATAPVFATATPVLGQDGTLLAPGDVVRIDSDFVGTLMSIDEATLTIIGQGKPTCWPGISHGDAPRCDPAPSVRRVVDWLGTTVERQLVERSYTKNVIVGFLLGAAAGGPIGYATGPSLGYGKISVCAEQPVPFHRSSTRIPGADTFCSEPILREEATVLQRAQDQRRGAFFFSLIGGSVGAIIARRMADDWLVIRPPASIGGDGPWSMEFEVPLPAR